MKISTGEAVIRLLSRYGVDTVFGIPGVHTLEFYRGLGEGSAVRHIQARNEMGAGFMADGYARASGKPGVLLTISGPGVTNALTPLGQAYNDSVPILLISAEARLDTLGKGWGTLHEVTDLCAVTRPVTAFSALARQPEDIPDLMAQAFSHFASSRPRPVHIAIPVDVLDQFLEADWTPVVLPSRPQADAARLDAAAAMLGKAKLPVVIAGGGAVEADVQALVEKTGAIAVATNAGKGIMPDDHPLSLGGAISRPEVQALLGEADVVLAIGTELSETDSYLPRMAIAGQIIRIDIDPAKINDRYPATIGIIGDAASAARGLSERLGSASRERIERAATHVATIRASIEASLGDHERKHVKLLSVLRDLLEDEAIITGDACQVAYSASFGLVSRKPRGWFYGAGYCTLGFAFPLAAGAKIAEPERAVVVMAGDGGMMFCAQELITAAEQKLAIPFIVWDNQGYKQIRDDMRSLNVPRVAVDGIGPDFMALAKAYRCHGCEPGDEAAFRKAVTDALAADRPTLIRVDESSSWLAQAGQIWASSSARPAFRDTSSDPST
ncbi:MAG: 5-guanidino-2-oxopentanoate decarboxylase [Rhizobiaceae bacterium]